MWSNDFQVALLLKNYFTGKPFKTHISWGEGNNMTHRRAYQLVWYTDLTNTDELEYVVHTPDLMSI